MRLTLTSTTIIYDKLTKKQIKDKPMQRPFLGNIKLMSQALSSLSKHFNSGAMTHQGDTHATVYTNVKGNVLMYKPLWVAGHLRTSSSKMIPT
jgi:hypothetical protein